MKIRRTRVLVLSCLIGILSVVCKASRVNSPTAIAIENQPASSRQLQVAISCTEAVSLALKDKGSLDWWKPDFVKIVESNLWLDTYLSDIQAELSDRETAERISSIVQKLPDAVTASRQSPQCVSPIAS